MSPLSRSSTIEAQRDCPEKARKWRHLKDLFTPEIDVPDDLAERELKSAISVSTGVERAFLKQLLRDYTRFKDSPGSAVRNNVLQCWTFQEGATDNIMHSRASTDHSNCCCTNFFDKAKSTFYQWIVRQLFLPLSQHYHSTCSRRVRTDCDFCMFALHLLLARGSGGNSILTTRILRVISFEAIADNENGFFSARHKIIATLRGRLHSLPLAPNNAIAFLVAQSLKIPRPSLNLAKVLSIHDKRRRLLQPPSTSGSSPVITGQ